MVGAWRGARRVIFRQAPLLMAGLVPRMAPVQPGLTFLMGLRQSVTFLLRQERDVIKFPARIYPREANEHKRKERFQSKPSSHPDGGELRLLAYRAGFSWRSPCR